MDAAIIIEEVMSVLRRRYGKRTLVGRSTRGIVQNIRVPLLTGSAITARFIDAARASERKFMICADGQRDALFSGESYRAALAGPLASAL